MPTNSNGKKNSRTVTKWVTVGSGVSLPKTRADTRTRKVNSLPETSESTAAQRRQRKPRCI